MNNYQAIEQCHAEIRKIESTLKSVRDNCGEKAKREMYPGRIFSAYEYNGKEDRIYIITEWDRSSTCIMFPSEY